MRHSQDHWTQTIVSPSQRYPLIVGGGAHPRYCFRDRQRSLFMVAVLDFVVDGFLSMSLGSALSCCNIHVVVASCGGLALALRRWVHVIQQRVPRVWA